MGRTSVAVEYPFFWLEYPFFGLAASWCWVPLRVPHRVGRPTDGYPFFCQPSKPPPHACRKRYPTGYPFALLAFWPPSACGAQKLCPPPPTFNTMQACGLKISEDAFFPTGGWWWVGLSPVGSPTKKRGTRCPPSSPPSSTPLSTPSSTPSSTPRAWPPRLRLRLPYPPLGPPLGHAIPLLEPMQEHPRLLLVVSSAATIIKIKFVGQTTLLRVFATSAIISQLSAVRVYRQVTWRNDKSNNEEEEGSIVIL